MRIENYSFKDDKVVKDGKVERKGWGNYHPWVFAVYHWLKE